MSSPTKFEGQDAEQFLDYFKFTLEFKIFGGIEDGTVYPIDMIPCVD